MTKTTSTGRARSNGAATTAALAEQVQQLDGVVRQLTQDLPSTMAQALSQALAQSLGQAFAAAGPALAQEVSRQVRAEVALALAASAPPATSANTSPSPAASTPATPEVNSAPSAAPIPAAPVVPAAPSGRLSARVAAAEQRLGEWSGRQGQRLRQGREAVSRKAAQARATLAHKAGQVRQAASQQAEQVALWLKTTRHLQKRALASLGAGLLLALLGWLAGTDACAALLCLAASGCAWAACAERGWPRPAAQGPAGSPEPACPEEGGQQVIAPQPLPLAAPPVSDTTSDPNTPTPATAAPVLAGAPNAQPGGGADDLPAVEQQTDSAPAASNGQPSSIATSAVSPVAPSPLPA